MAKVYKVTMYLTDTTGHFDYASNNKELLEYELDVALDRLNVITRYAEIKQSDEFEWEDDLKINMLDAKTEDYEKYIKKE